LCNLTFQYSNMKIIKGLTFFVVLVGFGSCFDPPEFPDVPEIEFDRIEFVDGVSPRPDSLILYINFKDGNGDLGLDNEDPNYVSFPFNNTFFFQEKNGQVDTLVTFAVGNTGQYDFLEIPNPTQGKLVLPRTKNKPGYSYLPSYNCVDYEYIIDRKLIIEDDDYPAIEGTGIRIADTLYNGPPKDPSTPKFFQIQDTLLVAVNPNHYNIEIDFFEKIGAEFVEFDWRAAPRCTQSYDGRFPRLVEKSGSALEGTLRYTMNSIGLVELFSIKPLYLRIQIKDRALNRSNTIETPEFTLDKIKKK
jgi:hypothetical protein